ncbi:MAG TPA: filamentous hemagglutinin N-terminal domain-containing protein, partial [Acetobacteraceae bacterium]|nr:filamentous hemagglutinin N-terminal domain-containing protein [Acetobacteraceae bacterium]
MAKTVGVTARATKARGRRAVRLIGVMRRRRAALMVSTALQATVVLVLTVPGATSSRAQPAPNARPTGGQVVAGSAAISQSPNATTINQSSQRAAVNWKSFDVGSQQSVQFQQPSASATTLNRVTGPNPSQIAGRIDANGQIILVNQDSITFYKGAQVNAAGLMVSAAGISDKNFMAGRMVFDQAAHPNARVENQGNITVKETGLAALVAPQVVNSGVITAKLGHVVLAGASAATLDLYGDGLVSIDVTQQVTQVPVGPHGKRVTALITNTGTVIADGGTVQLTARAADGIVDSLITAGGRIAAGTAGGKAGVIALNGIGGSITVAGQLAATGDAPGVRGGQIEVVTNRGVTIARGARLDASGHDGGGTVAVGTTLARAKGGASVTARTTASKVTVHAGATIAADSLEYGDGGRIAVLSSGTTQMNGAITAKGGPKGGDGGFVEVSGDTLGYGGSIDTGAPVGAVGSILFDPGTLLVTAADGSLDPLSPPGVQFADGGTLESVSAGAVHTLGLTSNVTLQATTLLDVQASISVTHGLTMQSGGNLIVDPNLSVQAATTLRLDGFTGIILNNSLLSAAVVDLNAAGAGVVQLNTGSIVAGTLQSTSGIVGGATLIGAGNTIGTLGAMSVGAGNLLVTTTSALTVAGNVVADGEQIDLTSGGNLSIGQGATAGFLNAGTTGNILLAASGSITEPHGSITAGALGAASSGGSVMLTGGADQIGTIAGVTAPGDVAVIADPTVLTLSGTSTGRTLFFENPDPGGTIALSAATLKSTGATPRISLVGDKLTKPVTSTITLTSAGLIELAPATVGAQTTIDVTPGSPVDTLGAVFSAIQPGAGTLAIGGFTGPDNAGTVSAGNVVVASAVNLGGIGNALALLTTGSVSQLPAADLLNIGTLAGATGSLSLLNPGNQIGTIGGPTGIAGFTGLTAAHGNVEIFDARPLTVTGPVTATGATATTGNVFLQEAAGNSLTVGGLVTATNGATKTNKVSLATDLLAANGAASIQALGGTVEIAPTTPSLAVHLASGVDGLIIDSTALGAIQAGTLAIGTYHDAVHGGTVALSGTLISFENNVSLGGAAVPMLRLDTSGSIVQNGGTLAVGTLSASTHGAVGAGVTLTSGGAGNAIGALGDFAIGNGDLLLSNGVKLTEPASSTIYADNISINNQGSIALAGNLAASAGSVAVTSTGANDISVSEGLIGATGTIGFNAGGAFRQTGGTINGSDIGVIAATGVIQSGGTLFGFDANPANTAVTINPGAAGDFSQTGGVIASNDQVSINSANALSAGGSVIAVGKVTLAATGGFSSSGAVLSGADLAVSGASISQTGGTLGARGTATLTTPGVASQTAGIVSGATVDLIAGTIPADGFQGFSGAIAAVGSGSTTARQTLSGAVFPGDPPGAPTGPLTPPSLIGGAGALRHLRIETDASGYSFNTPLAADWIEFHTLNDDVENPGGLLAATLLSGTAGYTAASGFTLPGAIANADFRASANNVLNLGRSVDPFVTTGSFWLNDTGAPALTVAGTVHAGSALSFGQTIGLMSSGLIIDDSGTTSFPNGVSITTGGSLLAAAAIGGTVVTPGVIQLQADDFSILPLTPPGAVVSAPDGLVAIAPLTAGRTITVLGSASGPGTLLIGGGTAPLSAISALGATHPDTPAADTLALGSIDAGNTAPTAGGIVFDVNGGAINLTGVARTVQLNATGAVSQSGAGTLILPELAGNASSFTLEPSGTNIIATIGNSPSREAGGTIYHTDPTVLANLGNLTDITATSGDVQVRSTAGTMTVLGTVAVPDGRAIDLAAPALLIDHLSTPSTLVAGSFLGLGSLVAAATVTEAATVTPGQIRLASDALRILGAPGTAVVSAPDGMVAIAPFTPGNTITVVNSLGIATNGTIAVQDLDLINTIGILPSDPVGVATLAIGSTDGGATLPVGGIAIDASFDVRPIARTLSLFAANSGVPGAGLITQGSGDIITVNALTGSAGVLLSGAIAGTDVTSVVLPELNAIGTIGVLQTEGGLTSTFAGQGNLLATGDIVVHNNTDLAVHTLVHAGDDPTLVFHTFGVGSQTADLEAAPAGATLSGTLSVNGTIWAGIDGKLTGNVNLSGGSASTIGGVVVPGSVFASTGGSSSGMVTLAAGFASGTYNTACTATGCGIGISGLVWGNQGFGHTDADLAGLVQINTASSIDESAGTIGAVLLTGGAGGFANFSGGGTSAANQNWIATLGTFDSNLRFNLPVAGTLAPGFLLRDGRVPTTPLGAGLTVVGMVQDHGIDTVGTSSSGIEIMVRPTADAIADLVLQNSLVADPVTGTIDIEATGNVYQQAGAGIVSANALVAEAGTLPSSEV